MIQCQFENHDQVSLRHVTVGTIITRNNQVLLGLRGTFRGKPILESGKWGLIGGFLDRDETTTAAACREAREETGWVIDDLVLLRINDRPDRPREDRQNVDFLFTAKAVSQLDVPNEEVRTLRWFDLESLPPASEIAFDHAENLELYKRYLAGELIIPQLG